MDARNLVSIFIFKPPFTHEDDCSANVGPTSLKLVDSVCTMSALGIPAYNLKFTGGKRQKDKKKVNYGVRLKFDSSIGCS